MRSMTLPIPPSPPKAPPVEVKLFHRIEEMTREFGVTTDQIRTACNALDMLVKAATSKDEE